MTRDISDSMNPSDPRAPSEEQWAAMTPEQREAAVRALPAEVPLELMAPEGDRHRIAKTRVVQTLGGFFKRIGRQVYVSSELLVYYPDKSRFAPDVLVVTDVSPHERDRWVVSKEGKGLDLVLEVHVNGNIEKDYERNRKMYASLGIQEYFLLDRTKDRLFGWRLDAPSDRVYTPIVPQKGLYPSRVLEMDLMLDDTRVRFLYGMAPVPELEELSKLLEGVVRRVEMKFEREVEARLRAEQEKARVEQENARVERERDEALARVREMEELVRKLKGEDQG